MPNYEVHKDDLLEIGDPSSLTEPYLVVSEPDANRYCKVVKMPWHPDSKEITVYLGRWARVVGRVEYVF